jgi:PAS domain S-box-containing protein
MGNKNDKPHSIIRRLIISLTATIGIVSFIASTLLAMNAARKGEIALIAEADKAIVHLSRALEKPLWDFDVKGIVAVGEVYKEDRQILQVEINNSVQNPLYSFQRGDLANSIQRSGKIMHGDREMGEVKIVFSREPYQERVWQIIQATIISNLLMLISIFITTGFMVRAYLRQPLRHLTEIVNCYASENYTPSARIIPFVEFQPFGKVLTQMGEKIHSQLKELQGEVIVRKQAEAEMRTLRNYLKNIVDSMPSALIGVDREGLVTQWNKEAALMTGLTADQAQGQSVTDVLPRAYTKKDKIKQAIMDRAFHQDSTIARQEEGETRYSDITIYPLISNGVDGAVIRIDDVTERVQIEEMMVQSEKMLSVGGLAAGMAHEINNPLAGIIQNTEVISRRLANNLPANERAAAEAGTTIETIRAFMEIRGIPKMLVGIRESGKRAAEIVSNMLSFAHKSDTGASFHDMPELLDKTLALAATDYDLKKQYDFKNIRIVKEYEKDLPQVPCEAGTIQQVILNILRNGAEAMWECRDAAQKPCFTLRIADETPTGMIRIEIEDNGPGMDESTRRRLFEPFFTTKQVGLGTGLGLSVSYFIIVENHGGRMKVESSPGKGARFIIHLPV